MRAVTVGGQCRDIVGLCCVVCYVLHGLKLDRLGHARGGDVTGRIRQNLYDCKLLQEKLEHLQVRAWAAVTANGA